MENLVTILLNPCIKIHTSPQTLDYRILSCAILKIFHMLFRNHFVTEFVYLRRVHLIRMLNPRPRKHCLQRQRGINIVDDYIIRHQELRVNIRQSWQAWSIVTNSTYATKLIAKIMISGHVLRWIWI